MSIILLQAMEDNSVRQAKIVDALEAEKKKISRDLEEMQRKLALRGNKALRSGKDHPAGIDRVRHCDLGPPRT